jgi:two-component system response regulator AlgR
MPGMNGLECAEQFSHLNPRPAIVFCTAYDQHALEAFKSQAQAYF